MPDASPPLRTLGWPSLLLALAAAGPAAGGAIGLGLAYSHAETLRDGGPAIAGLLVLSGLIGCGLWLLPTHVMALVCGWALGLWAGASAALLTATAAAPLGYLVARRLAGPGVGRWLDRYPRGAAVCEAITREAPARAGFLVALLRVTPVVPYGATNVLAAAFGLPLGAFLVGTCLGLAPRIVAVAALGAGLERLDASRAGTGWWALVGLLATVAAIALMGRVTQRALQRAVPAPVQTAGHPRQAGDHA